LRPADIAVGTQSFPVCGSLYSKLLLEYNEKSDVNYAKNYGSVRPFVGSR